MKSIQSLHDAANKERLKAQDLRKSAEKHHLRAIDTADEPALSLPETNEAQKLETKAAQHDQTAMKFEQEATDLEAKALQLNQQKVEIQNASQSQINRLEAEEKMLRGE